ncbi:dihydrodipicolinate synthase family protein [Mariniluteicoccus endophyticus]
MTFDLHGIVPPVVTPLTADGAVDHAALATHVERLVAAGVHGLFALGSTSEVAYFTDADRARIIDTTLAAVDGRVPVLAGCIDLTAARVVDQARSLSGLGLAGIVCTGPFYAINDLQEIVDHFRRIRDGVDLPVYAYDVPVRVHCKLPAPLVVELGREGVIAGLKDSSGDDVGFRRMIRLNEAAGHPLKLFSGHEVFCDGVLLAGADGIVPGLANVDPAGYVRLWDAACAGDWEAARAEQEKLNDLFEIVFTSVGRSGDAAGVGAFKQAMVELGMIARAEMAHPVKTLDEPARQAVKGIVAGWR